MAIKELLEKESARIFVLIALALFLLFYRLGSLPLWDPDEGRHALVAREMVLSGDWVTPRFNGENFYDKPILYYWLNALAFQALGMNELAARLPAAFLGLAGVLITYALGRALLGKKAALLGGFVLATDLGYIIFSRAVVHDISLAVSISLALLFFYQGYRSPEPARRRTCFLLLYPALGLAVLAKGPVGLLLPVLVIGAFLLSQGELKLLREMRWGWGAVLLGMVALPWYGLVAWRNPDFLPYFLWHQNVGSFVSFAQANHPQPVYYYFPVLMAVFFPWSCFLPVALAHAWNGLPENSWFRGGASARCLRLLSSIRGSIGAFLSAPSDRGSLCSLPGNPPGGLGKGSGSPREDREEKKEVSFLLLWFALVFAFFSLAASKLPAYLFPLFPPASLLVGKLWRDGLADAGRSRSLRGLTCSALFCALLSLAVVIASALYLSARFSLPLSNFLPCALILIAGGAASYLFLLRGKRWASFISVGLIAVFLLPFALGFVFPWISPYRSAKGLASQLNARLAPHEKIVFYHRMKESALFYTGRQGRLLRGRQELMDYLSADGRAYCLMEERRYRKLDGVLKKRMRIVAREGDQLLLATFE